MSHDYEYSTVDLVKTSSVDVVIFSKPLHKAIRLMKKGASEVRDDHQKLRE